jgi:hypothetical protein
MNYLCRRLAAGMVMIDLDILFTCAVYLLLAGSLTHIILEAKGRKARKKRGCMEVYLHFGLGLAWWGFSFLFNTLFTLGYYTQFFSNDFHLTNYLTTSVVFLLLLPIAYYEARWKVVIDGKKVIKYGWLFKKRTIYPT